MTLRQNFTCALRCCEDISASSRTAAISKSFCVNCKYQSTHIRTISSSLWFQTKMAILDSKTRATFSFKFSPLFSGKIDTPESFIVLFITTKVGTFISVEGSKTLFRSLNGKIYYHLITCCRTFDILAKTVSRRLTTATTFSRKNDVSSRARAHFLVLRKSRSVSHPRLRI